MPSPASAEWCESGGEGGWLDNLIGLHWGWCHDLDNGWDGLEVAVQEWGGVRFEVWSSRGLAFLFFSGLCFGDLMLWE